MTIYGETDQQFRPGAVAFTIAAFCLLVLSAQFTTLSLSLLDAAFAWANDWRREIFLYAPLADEVQHRLLHVPPVGPRYLLLPVALATGSILIALILALFWPAEGRASSILAVYSFALSLVTFGAVAIAFDPFQLEELENRTEVKRIIWSVLLGLVALRAAIAVERKALQVLSNVVPLRTRGERLKWWTLRILPAFLALAALSLLNGYLPGAMAAGAVLLVSLLENLARVPRQTFQSLRNPRLLGAAAILPFVTAAVLAGSIYLFGMEALGFPRQVVAYTRPYDVKVESLEVAKKRTEPVLEIKWIRPPTQRSERARERESEKK